MPLFSIDVTSYLASNTGIGLCIGQLVRAMLEDCSATEDRFRLCAISLRGDSKSRLSQAFPGLNREIRTRQIPVRFVRKLVDSGPYPCVEDLFGAADLFHASHLLVPASKRTPVVVTVYDLTPLRFPKYHLSSNRFTLEQLKRWLDRADLVIVNSSSTADDLREKTAIPCDKLRIVSLGINSCFRPLVEGSAEALVRLEVRCEYILSVGALEPRKNLPRLLEAFRVLKDRYRIPHVLVLAGPEGWGSDAVRRAVRDLKLEADVLFPGYIDYESLNCLYNRATLLIYPSLYEGFGLPPLEAMAAGCPVAVSRTSSLPEVVGDAGLYFDPYNVEEIAETAYQILDRTDLRRKLVEAGKRRSRDFSWEKAAEDTRRVYLEAGHMRRRR